MGFDNVCLQRRDLPGLAMHQCDIDSNAWFHRVLFEVDLWQEPNGGEKNGTSIGQRWDVFTGLRGCPLYIGRVYAYHHKWYITRDLSAVLVSRRVFGNYLGFAAALNHLLTVLYFLWDLFFFFGFSAMAFGPFVWSRRDSHKRHGDGEEMLNEAKL